MSSGGSQGTFSPHDEVLLDSVLKFIRKHEIPNHIWDTVINVANKSTSSSDEEAGSLVQESTSDQLQAQHPAITHTSDSQALTSGLSLVKTSDNSCSKDNDSGSNYPMKLIPVCRRSPLCDNNSCRCDVSGKQRIVKGTNLLQRSQSEDSGGNTPAPLDPRKRSAIWSSHEDERYAAQNDQRRNSCELEDRSSWKNVKPHDSSTEKANRSIVHQKSKIMSSSYFEKFFKCHSKSCMFATNNRDEFYTHINTHGTSEPLECFYCKMPCQTNRMVDHMVKEHGRRIFQCGYCIYRAISLDHIQLHHNDKHEYMNFHYIQCKEVSSDNPCLSSPSSPSREPKILREPFVCKSRTGCLFKSVSAVRFENHWNVKHKDEALIKCCRCDHFEPNLPSLMKHYMYHKMFPFYCSYCSFGTITQEKLQKHSLEHPDYPLLSIANDVVAQDVRGSRNLSNNSPSAAESTSSKGTEKENDDRSVSCLPQMVQPPGKTNKEDSKTRNANSDLTITSKDSPELSAKGVSVRCSTENNSIEVPNLNNDKVKSSDKSNENEVCIVSDDLSDDIVCEEMGQMAPIDFNKLIESPTRIYQCVTCNSAKISTSQIKDHVKRFHHRQTLLFCKLCLCVFGRSREELQPHIRDLHPGDEPIFCTLETPLLFSKGNTKERVKKVKCLERNNGVDMEAAIVIDDDDDDEKEDQKSKSQKNRAEGNIKRSDTVKNCHSEKADIKLKRGLKTNDSVNMEPLIISDEEEGKVREKDDQSMKYGKNRTESNKDDDVVEVETMQDGKSKETEILSKDETLTSKGEKAATCSNPKFKGKCTSCAVTFKSYRLLRQHTKSHKKTHFSFKCGMCNCRLKVLAMCFNHYKEKHANCLEYRVVVDVKGSNASNYSKSVDFGFKCNICKHVFRPPLTFLERHLRERHQIRKSSRCSYCDSQEDVSDLSVHFKDKHPGKSPKAHKYYTEVFISNQSNNNSQEYSFGEPYKCSVCLCLFPTLGDVENHLKHAHKSKDSHLIMRAETVKVNGTKGKYRSPLTCCFCGSFGNKSWIRRHLCEELDYKPFRCAICNFAAVDVDDIDHHSQECHPGVEQKYHVTINYTKQSWIEDYICTQEGNITMKIPISCMDVYPISLKAEDAQKDGMKCPFCVYIGCRETVSYHLHQHLHYFPYCCKVCKYKAAAKPEMEKHMMQQHANMNATYDEFLIPALHSWMCQLFGEENDQSCGNDQNLQCAGNSADAVNENNNPFDALEKQKAEESGNEKTEIEAEKLKSDSKALSEKPKDNHSKLPSKSVSSKPLSSVVPMFCDPPKETDQFKCAHCNEGPGTMSLLRCHWELQHRNLDFRLKRLSVEKHTSEVVCFYCSLEVSSVTALKQHSKLFHPQCLVKFKRPKRDQKPHSLLGNNNMEKLSVAANVNGLLIKIPLPLFMSKVNMYPRVAIPRLKFLKTETT